jgi:hypothetical protein
MKSFSGLISFHPNSASIVSDRGTIQIFIHHGNTASPHCVPFLPRTPLDRPRVGPIARPWSHPQLLLHSDTLLLTYWGPCSGSHTKTPYPTLPYPTLPSPPHPTPPLLGHHQLLVFYGFPSSINQRPSSLLLARVHHAKAYKLQLGARQWSITTWGNHSKLACGWGGGGISWAYYPLLKLTFWTS